MQQDARGKPHYVGKNRFLVFKITALTTWLQEEQVQVSSEAAMNNAVSQTKQTTNVHHFIFYNLHKMCNTMQGATHCMGSHYAWDHTHFFLLRVWSNFAFSHNLYLVILCIWWHSAFGHILHRVTLCIESKSAIGNILLGVHFALGQTLHRMLLNAFQGF